MTERVFPDDHQVDQWISSHFADATDTSPAVDQMKAAAADSVNRFQSNAPGMVAAGMGQWAALGIRDKDRTKIRGAVRQVMAAESVGVMPLCPHVQQIRPMVFVCDPPIMVCAECLPSRTAVIKTLGHIWNHECDRCGVRAETMTPTMIGGLGHITVSGHVCDRCAAEDVRIAAQNVEQVVVLDRAARRRAQRKAGRR